MEWEWKRRINVWGFFCTKQRSGFQRWGKDTNHSSKTFWCKDPLFYVCIWGSWRGKNYLSASIPQHLPSLSTFSPVHQSQKVALRDDKYSLSLPAEARVLRCKRKNSIAGKAFLNFILKNKKTLNIPGGDFPLIGSYCFLEKPLVFKSVLKHTLRKCCIAVGHLACNQSILSV